MDDRLGSTAGAAAAGGDRTLAARGSGHEGTDTRITSASPRTSARHIKFRFVSTESASWFQCKLDRRVWTVCRAPKSYRGLARGLHVFRVRARDGAGNLDQTPAVRRWRIR